MILGGLHSVYSRWDFSVSTRDLPKTTLYIRQNKHETFIKHTQMLLGRRACLFLDRFEGNVRSHSKGGGGLLLSYLSTYVYLLLFWGRFVPKRPRPSLCVAHNDRNECPASLYDRNVHNTIYIYVCGYVYVCLYLRNNNDNNNNNVNVSIWHRLPA